jgi:uncharacterized protein (DUF58 family)
LGEPPTRADASAAAGAGVGEGAERRTSGRVTELLSNDALDRLGRMRLAASKRFTSRSSGEHLAGRGGSSMDFADYRDYAPGDDLRFVDWNAFARLHRPYLKLYRREEVMHVVILLDVSDSMRFEGKLDLAKSLAAAFAVLGLCGTERVSVWAVGSLAEGVASLSPCAGRGSMRNAFRFIEGIQGGGDAPVDAAIETMLKYHHGRGVAVLLSDFLTFGDLRRTFNLLFSAGLETYGLQVLGPSELDPDVGGDVKFVDCEDGRTLDVSSANDLLAIYNDCRLSHERTLAALCRQRGGRFMSMSSDVALAWVLFDRMRREGWIE